MQLIDNWKTSWKLYSMIATILLAAFNGAVAANFYGLLDNLTSAQIAGINALFAGIVIPILRIVKQFADEQAPPAPPAQPTEGQP